MQSHDIYSSHNINVCMLTQNMIQYYNCFLSYFYSIKYFRWKNLPKSQAFHHIVMSRFHTRNGLDDLDTSLRTHFLYEIFLYLYYILKIHVFLLFTMENFMYWFFKCMTANTKILVLYLICKNYCWVHCRRLFYHKLCRTWIQRYRCKDVT